MMSSENLPSPSKAIDWSASLPWTWGLIAIVFVVHLSSGLLDWWRGYESLFDALVMDRSVRMRVAVGGQLDLNIAQGEVFRFATSTLLHGDALHLFVNSLAILGLGRIIEPLYGGFRMLVCFSFGAVVASVGSHFVGVAQSDGASGGASTLFAMAIVLGLVYRKEWVAADRRLMGPVLWAFLGLNLLLSLVLPFVDGVGHGVGFLVGLPLGLLLPGRWKWLDRSLGTMWIGTYCFSVSFGAWWVVNGWTAERWAKYWYGP